MEFRGHEHVLECAIFAPINSYPFIQELIGDEVIITIISYRTQIRLIQQ